MSSAPVRTFVSESDVRAGSKWSDMTLMTVSQTAGVIPRHTVTSDPPRAADLSKYKVCREGDLVLNRFNAYRGALGVAPETGIVSPDYCVLRVRKNADPRYLDYWLRAEPTVNAMLQSMGGIGASDPESSGFSRVSIRSLMREKIVEGNVHGQALIANFLDRETAKIDAMIEKQRTLVDGLRLRRISAIGGRLDPRSMEDGVWTRLPLKRTIRFQEGPGILSHEFRDEGVPLLRISCAKGREVTLDGCNFLDPETVASRWRHFGVTIGDLIISASASMGTVSEVTDTSIEGAIPYTGLIRIMPGAMTQEFAKWFFVSPEFLRQIEHFKSGSTMQHFGPSHLAQMSVWLPDAATQRRIAQQLENEVGRIDALIARSERLIELSQERRSALITAAVTGQINIATDTMALEGAA